MNKQHCNFYHRSANKLESGIWPKHCCEILKTSQLLTGESDYFIKLVQYQKSLTEKISPNV